MSYALSRCFWINKYIKEAGIDFSDYTFWSSVSAQGIDECLTCVATYLESGTNQALLCVVESRYVSPIMCELLK